jgi:hypothetical protein
MNVAIKDLSGKSSFASSNCFITNFAPLAFSDSLQDRTWTIHCLSTYDVFVGSNYIPIANIFN